MHTLYGSDVSETKVVGYCKCHRKWLTLKQLKRHKCLGKACPKLERKEEHPYWAERERIKALKKAR